MKLFPLVNQKKNYEFLQNVIKGNRVSNAYLFHGTEGCGHEGFAIEFAAMLNCTSSKAEACGECPSCHKMKSLEYTDLQLLFPIPRSPRKDKKDPNPYKGFSEKQMEEIQAAIKNKTKNPYFKIHIEQARTIPIDLIRYTKKNIYFASRESGWKVVIIFDAHLLTGEAANAFLKILEEPPKNTTFILTTSNMSRILSTIKSRCQNLFFPPLDHSEIKSYLAPYKIPEDQIDLLINLSGGDLGQAIKLCESDISVIKQQTLDIMRAVAIWNVAKIYQTITNLASIHREEPADFFHILQSINFWFRDAAVIRAGESDPDLIHSDQITEITNFVKKFPDFDAHLMNISVENCIDFIKRNVYINVALLDMFFKINNAINPKENK